MITFTIKLCQQIVLMQRNTLQMVFAKGSLSIKDCVHGNSTLTAIKVMFFEISWELKSANQSIPMGRQSRRFMGEHQMEKLRKLKLFMP